ncbi:putative neutral sphingomyelinase isoform X2 [Octopus bimaculoides]|uniref:putative neutral sphingomyelinase isoform X2 n=1 Tax=Octopus bimaculoides TaxID=37653 RepID=UPI00071E460D|nr:putative neutral sphingomyelinase isoform X2 [Octopus bimaculoides]|eukprot:XP_014781096.1 PREDICTED: putative neutral sphingomyelinase isoform X2 [Octopus bimaculoides]
MIIMGIPFPVICKDKNFRVKSLAKALSESEYDIILLQEIWCISDFEHLKSVISNKLPHSHYFHRSMQSIVMLMTNISPIA